MIESGRLDGPALDRLTALLPPPTAHAAIHRSLVGEAKVLHDALTRFFGFRMLAGDGMLGRGHDLFAPLQWLLRPLLLENDRACLQYMSRLIEWQRMKRHERNAAPPELRLRPWHVVLETVTPNLVNVVERSDLWEARESMTRLAVAIERYGAAHGSAPDTLDALVPTFVDAVAKDPFGDGATFIYRRIGNGWDLAAGESWRGTESAKTHDPVLEWSRR